MLQVCDTRVEERLAGEGELLAGLQVIFSNIHFCTVGKEIEQNCDMLKKASQQ